MKFSLVLLLLLAVDIQAQNLADMARAERKRQQSVEATRVIVKVGERPSSPVEPDVPVVTSVQKEPEPPKVGHPENFEQEFQAERVDLLKRRSALLLKLGGVIRDRDVVKQIEEELQQIQNRAAQLKVERLSKSETSPR